MKPFKLLLLIKQEKRHVVLRLLQSIFQMVKERTWIDGCNGIRKSCLIGSERLIRNPEISLVIYIKSRSDSIYPSRSSRHPSSLPP